METTTQEAPVSKGRLWTGYIISGLVVLFMIFDGVTKVMKVPQVIQASAKIGYNATTVVGIGATLLVCTALYVIPRTSIFGAILLTGYLGGAVDANVHSGTALFNITFPMAFGVLAWLGIYLRDRRLRALVPLRS
ncbi:MAG TPA: DoxX family protein [Verrucomicrobiae bacterium]|nr:DoxX family protein [Verrucomicrobiae bacterium]